MSQKITISELRTFIQKESLKLFNIYILKERKDTIENKLKVIAENEKTINPEIYQEIYDEIEMMMRPEDYTLTYDELNDIANSNGMDFEDVLNIQQHYLKDRQKEEEKDLKNDAEDVLMYLHRKRIESPNFLEFAHEFNSMEHVYSHSPEDIRAIFDKLTKDPKQLAMFEKRLAEDFGETLGSNCMDNPKVCMSKPSQIIDPRGEMEEAFGKTPQSFLDPEGNLTNIASDIKLQQAVDKWLERVQSNSDKKFETEFENIWTIGGAPKFTKKIGEKFIKISSVAPGSNSAFAFIDLNGNIYKPASFRVPAKGIRGNIYDENAPITSWEFYR